MGECEVDNEASVSSGGQTLAWRYVGHCFKHFLLVQVPTTFFLFLDDHRGNMVSPGIS